ncbi:hypothetical protein [Hahella ganghwensis]|uniref:hypothetical protein n=1 Tax=Hahella ganghwensis TaxID=286420 RepID=UPI00036DDE0D|nr:hypothetical protein [Hahella ganghwensis]
MEAARMINEPQELAKEALIAAGHNSGCVPHTYFLHMMFSNPPLDTPPPDQDLLLTLTIDMRQFVLNSLAQIR